ncbi:MAG: hypothetical protein UY98_C0029G0002 [Candidatus Kaiserbacteria bacterium GW2011_GWA2_58_9]|uniref:Gluconeogenesis factor n=1 Tax=Candidatus Kaiserbacteria bacterium GW2011_GWA2_58_9 TaxID=1618672 RepID=A0A0G1YT34_9BACT|nr:MAG: hypothetical protein UY98_C0029G0002 [Candidatus Kaiserbacteria bacterium GW2011_GWA2_58_9]
MKKIVTIGGGTGSYVVLRGLKEFPLDIAAVVSMFDSGGSSGVLRDECGVLPPGDVRRCLLALSEGTRAEILRELFNYRFGNGGSLKGHSFGNLFLVALSSIYGGDIEGIRKASELLDLKGRVLPVSLDKAHLHVILEDDTEVVGEDNIYNPKHDGALRVKRAFLKPGAKLYDETARAIREADVVVICPGSLYASLVPNFLVGGMAEALRESRAKKVAVADLMTQWGQTNGFVASDMMDELLRYSGLSKFDYVICNTAGMDAGLLAAYAKEGKRPIHCDEKLYSQAWKVITGDFFSEADIARHDSAKVAKVISEL